MLFFEKTILYSIICCSSFASFGLSLFLVLFCWSAYLLLPQHRTVTRTCLLFCENKSSYLMIFNSFSALALCIVADFRVILSSYTDTHTNLYTASDCVKLHICMYTYTCAQTRTRTSLLGFRLRLHLLSREKWIPLLCDHGVIPHSVKF